MRKLLATIAVLFSGIAVTAAAQTKQAGRDWPYHQADAAGTRFSTLTQINTTNVKNLKHVWTFHTGSGRFASAPMVIDSVIYFSAPNGVYAVDGVTGNQLWRYAPPAGSAAAGRGRGGGRGAAAAGAPAGAARGAANNGNTRPPTGDDAPTDEAAGTATRGPAYWPGGNGVGPRIYSTTNLGMTAIDARTGKLVTSFGENGVLPDIRPNSPPVIYKNFLIAKGPREPIKGQTVKGFDVVTGEPRWTFYVKASPATPTVRRRGSRAAPTRRRARTSGHVHRRRAARDRLHPG